MSWTAAEAAGWSDAKNEMGQLVTLIAVDDTETEITALWDEYSGSVENSVERETFSRLGSLEFDATIEVSSRFRVRVNGEVWQLLNQSTRDANSKTWKCGREARQAQRRVN
jgi:hypothetical protein